MLLAAREVLVDWLTVFANAIFPEEQAERGPEMQK